ncbi:hypothetical protein ACFQZ4_19245 [Catellatospora coxensis]
MASARATERTEAFATVMPISVLTGRSFCSAAGVSSRVWAGGAGWGPRSA